MEFLSAEIVEEDVEREDVFHSGDGEMFGENVSHSGIVDGADGDGDAAVDFGGEVCFG